MPDPAATQILYPVFAMFALVVFVLARMAKLRFGAVRSGQMNAAFYKTYQGDEEPEHMRVVTRHFLNLFEMPVLFYVGVLMAFVTQQVAGWMVVAAWAYVGLRYAHSYVHLTSNDVLLRFRLYIVSCLVLVMLWAGLFVRLLLSS